MFTLLVTTPKVLLIDNNSSINTVIMNFLSIDFSTDNCLLFVKHQNKTFSKVLQSDKSSIDLTMEQILVFFTKNHLKFEDLNTIFVNQGPGNFSGLRCSISIAKGISLTKNLKLFGYDTFILLCAKYFNKKNSILSLIKFNEKYFIKGFNQSLKSTFSVKKINKEEIIQNYKKDLKLIPKNLIINFDKKLLELNNLKIVDLDHKELEFLQIKGLLNEDLIKPLYLS